MATLLTAAGVLLIVAGLAVFIPPLVQLGQRANADSQALHQWKDPGSALANRLPESKTDTLPNSTPGSTSPSCGSGAPSSSYALIDFPSLSGIEGVAGNGTWSMLHVRSVVHYASSPGPGQPGNGIYALHREPNFEPLGTLKVGDTIVLTDRDCQQFTYVIRQTWTEYPAQVTQLQPLSQGTWITVITCTPLWLDYQRLVLRAQLQAT
ncbi:MAG: class E sortase [Candidatus Dormibacteria bacterium]